MQQEIIFKDLCEFDLCFESNEKIKRKKEYKYEERVTVF